MCRHKVINAIHSYGLENDRKQGGSGSSATPLIPTGRIFVIQQRFALSEERLKTTEQSEPTKREIVIAAIVFDDGTFEGEPDQAAEMAANMTGDRIQLLRINSLVDAVSDSALRDPEQFKKLKSDIAKLSEEVDPAVTNELMLRFSKLPKIRATVGSKTRLRTDYVRRRFMCCVKLISWNCKAAILISGSG